MDEIDSINEREAFFNQQAIDKIRAALSAQALTEGPEICEDCGDAIPKERRLAAPGCTLCVSCQAALERGLMWDV